MPDLAALQKTLGVEFASPALLEQALVHPSYLNENPDFSLPSYQRLEFLGDAVIDLVVAERLFEQSPPLAEGEMTALRAVLVRQETLAGWATSLGLGQHLVMGRGEEAGGGRHRPRNLAGALEAVVGAIYLDGGLEAAKRFLSRFMEAELAAIESGRQVQDYKSQLQELIQARQQPTPVYKTVEVRETEPEAKFVVEARSGRSLLGTGSGRSKRLAEMAAARNALERLGASGLI